MAMPGKRESREQEANSKVLFLTVGYMKNGWEYAAREMGLIVHSYAISAPSTTSTKNYGKSDRYFFPPAKSDRYFFKKFTGILQFFYTSLILVRYTIF